MDFILFIGLSLTIIVLSGIGITAVVEDIRSIHRQRASPGPTHPGYDRPIVTVLLSVDADTYAAQNSLISILESSYQPIEIIIIGVRRQRSELKKITKNLTTTSRPISIYTGSRTPSAAYRRYGHGTIVVALDSRSCLERHAIEHGVRHFHSLATTSELQASTITTSRYSTFGLLQTYATALGYFWNKLINVIEGIPAVHTSRVSLYRAEAYANPRPHLTKTYFADDVIVYRPATSFNRRSLTTAVAQFSLLYQALWHTASQRPLITGCRRLFAICLGFLSLSLPLLLSYAIYLAIAAHQPLPLLVSITLIGVYVIVGLWSQPGRSWAQKLHLSLLVPICLVPFYALSFVAAAATLLVCAQTLRTLAVQSLGEVKSLLAR